MKFTEVQLSKRDCVREEIHGSIRLLAWDGNFIAAQVVASAATQILTDVGNSLGEKTMKSEFLKSIKPQHHQDVKKLLNSPYNFMKHADKDTHATLEHYRIERAIWQVFQACYNYMLVYEIHTYPMEAFCSWHGFLNPNILGDDFRDKTPWARLGLVPSDDWKENLETLRGIVAGYFDNPIRLESDAGPNASRFEWNRKSLLL